MPASSKKRQFPYSFGWLPDLPDSRDYTKDTPTVAKLLKTPKLTSLPSKTDLREWCPPIFDQGNIGSCTANAAAALLAYHNKRAFGKDTPLSRLFIYKATRDLMMEKGDSGAYIRTTMGSLALFGSPPEKYWSYALGGTNASHDPPKGSPPTGYPGIDDAPPAFCYSYASNYQALSYFRLDEKAAGIPSKNKDSTLLEIKQTLASSLPVMFGFQVFESIKGAVDGKIPYPKRGESILGGHAVLAVGYDDSLSIGSGDNEKVGAFLIRNSWGESWGDRGYGWLPYEYVLGGLAEDWWCFVKAEWMDTEGFDV